QPDDTGGGGDGRGGERRRGRLRHPRLPGQARALRGTAGVASRRGPAPQRGAARARDRRRPAGAPPDGDDAPGHRLLLDGGGERGRGSGRGRAGGAGGGDPRPVHAGHGRLRVPRTLPGHGGGTEHTGDRVDGQGPHRRGPRPAGGVGAGGGPEGWHGAAPGGAACARAPWAGQGWRRRSGRGFVMAGERILVIDDNPANLRLLRLLLAAESYEVRTADGAEEAMAILEDF